MLLGDEQKTVKFADVFARALKPGDCVALYGDLGAGKSTFCRAIIRALAADENLEVPSPTFTLVQHYETVPAISHMDFYRLGGASEVEELGLDSALQIGVVLIEWPSKAEEMLPGDRINITLSEVEHDPSARQMHINAPQDFLQRLHRSQEIADFIVAAGFAEARRAPFSGDASARNYELLYIQNHELPLILMDAPRQADGPAIYDGLPYSQVVHLAEDVRAFVAISTLLTDRGFCAPKIIAHDIPNGLLLTQNLGAGKIVDGKNVPIADRYIAAAETLAVIHNQAWPNKVGLPDGSTHTIARYDVRAMRMGLSLLPDWWGKENALTRDQADALYSLWQPRFERFQEGYDDLIIRDYHSPNIIWRGDKHGVQRIGIIDHQDALIGPGLYDVASLVQDARTCVMPELQSAIIDAYCAARARTPDFDEAVVRADIATLCAFRASRLLGLWVRLDVRDGKPRFRQYVKQTKTYLAQALAHGSLNDLRGWYVSAGVIDG
ncbi:MAG: tRNA (adenosine(37)-N6)-threonylcarbamoyltransferase complex ATPase subunit type 1 TsaE [Ahrensia sp.]|nr:tRNA (adenosine(37)-N6)-threonylcarbamoyltransferase complex ATPase subunit type 1 TsaE [Ahrensia sp.]